jgi:hypothetical protein
VGAAAVLFFLSASGGAAGAEMPADPYPGPTPRALCGPGASPEPGRQGRRTAQDIQAFTCNTDVVGHVGTTGGYKVERYVDAAGHECAYYDTTLLFPKDTIAAGRDFTGVYVLDMSNPANPVRTETLLTPAMQSPHESMALNTKRGLLLAVAGNPTFYPGVIDAYDVSQDCRHPVLKSSLPSGLLGHESGFAPDGLTYYSASLDGGTITAVDVTNPAATAPLWIGNYRSHGLNISDDGNRAYVASRSGLIILDVSQIQARVKSPQVKVVSTLTWPTMSTPQIATPVTINQHPFVIEIDEFGSGNKIGAARIIDIADETKPKVVSNIKLEVNMPAYQAEQAADPGATTPFRGYTGHYCEVPTRHEPGVLACSFILSGLRLFDIRDPYRPREIAYFNPPPRSTSPADPKTDYAMSKPAFVPERGEIWYTDGNSGFYALRVTNEAWPFAGPDPGRGAR